MWPSHEFVNQIVGELIRIRMCSRMNAGNELVYWSISWSLNRSQKCFASTYWLFNNDVQCKFMESSSFSMDMSAGSVSAIAYLIEVSEQTSGLFGLHVFHCFQVGCFSSVIGPEALGCKSAVNVYNAWRVEKTGDFPLPVADCFTWPTLGNLVSRAVEIIKNMKAFNKLNKRKP